MGKGAVPSHRLSNSWPASRHVILRTSPKRQSQPLYWSDIAAQYSGLPGPSLAGCEALPARGLPGLRNPLISGLLILSSNAFSRQALPGAELGGPLACRLAPCRQALSSEYLGLVITLSYPQQGLLRYGCNRPCTSTGYQRTHTLVHRQSVLLFSFCLLLE